MTIMTKRGSLDNIVTYEHICDTPEDLDNINKKESTLGSTALVLQDEGGIGIYIANSAGEWIYASGGNKGEQLPAMTIHVCSSSEVDAETGFPTISEPIENMLYLVPAQDPSSGNLYDEYVYLNNSWEKFGSGQVAAAVQADWQENDNTAASYVQNRPGGYTIIDKEWTTVADIDSVTWQYGTYNCTINLNFHPGNTVQWRITFDGNTTTELNSIVDVSDGNGYSYEIQPDNQTFYPQICIYQNGTNHYISSVTIDTESSTEPSTIKIEVRLANVVKIDSKFLPDILPVTLVMGKTSVIFNDNIGYGPYKPNTVNARNSQIFGYNHNINGRWNQGFNFVTGVGHSLIGNEDFTFFEGQNNYVTYGDSMGQWYGAANHLEGLSNRAIASIGGHIEGICNEMGSDTGLHYGLHVMGIGNNQGSIMSDGSYVAGRASNPSRDNVETIGNGTYSLSQTQNADGLNVYTLNNVTRSNARTLDWSGNEWLAGNLTVAGGSLILNATTLNESSLQQLLGTSTTLNSMQNKIGAVQTQAYVTLPNSIQARTQVEEIYEDDNDSDYAGYITTSGATVNTTPTADSSWVHIIESCSEGDCFAVTGQAGSNARLWCFVDASGNNLKARANLAAWVENEKIIAPPGASLLIVNFLKSRSHRLLRGWPADQYGNEVAIQQLAAAISGYGVFISQQPQNVAATVGDTVSFSIDTIGTPTKYQWQYLTTAANWRDSGLSGFNTKTITMEATEQRNKTFWRCIVDDTIISNEAFLTISASNG